MLRKLLRLRRRFPQNRQSYRFRLRFEALEERLPLALLTVTNLADNLTPGGGVTLREAIQAANTDTSVDGVTGNGDDTIQFEASLFSGGPGTINLTGALPDLSSNLAIQGPGSSLLTVRRDTGGNYRIFTVTNGMTVSLVSLTIANGNATTGPFFGGGVYSRGALTVSQTTISGNIANEGGGIMSAGAAATLTVNNSTVSGNMVNSRGGGIFNNFGTVTVNNSSLSGNTAQSGGGIENFNGGTLTVTDSTLSGNIASAGEGGGIDNCGALTITGSTLFGNQANTDGGGIQLTCGFSTPLTISNSTLSGNLAKRDGGGIHSYTTAPLTLTNITLTNNRADHDNNGSGSGGGLFREGAAVTLHNTVVAGNFQDASPSTTADDIGGTVEAASSFNLIGSGGAGGLTNGTNSNQVGVSSPGLGVLQNNGGPTVTHALLPASPAIDAGSNAVATSAGLTTDQRSNGFVRTADGNGDATATVDIGAFEVQSLVVTTLADAGAGSLRDALATANTRPGIDAIRFAAIGAVMLTSGQLTIGDPLIIQGRGDGPTTVNGQNNSRLFDISSTGGAVTFDRLTLTGGRIDAENQTGGAIRSASAGPLNIQNSTIFGNSTTADFAHGGGISAAGSVAITNSTISGNFTNGSLADGGGIHAIGSVTIINSTITGNHVGDANAGGVFSQNGPVTIENSIVAENLDTVDGSHPDLRPAGILTVRYTLIGDNNGTGLPAATVAASPDFNLVGTHAVPIPALLSPLAFHGGPTRTHRPLAGSPVMDAGSNALATAASLTTDQRGASYVRIVDGPDADLTATVEMGAVEVPPSNKIGAHRGNQFYQDVNGNGQWNGVAGGDRLNAFGNSGDVPLVGDWNGDGWDEIGVQRGNLFYLDRNGNGVWNGTAGGDLLYTFRNAGDKPLIGDWDGDGDDQIGVQNGNQFYMDRNSNGIWDGVAGGDLLYAFGNSGDVPLAGDWDGDGDDQIGVQRGSAFYLDRNGNGIWNNVAGGDRLYNFGATGDVPLIGDWNADGTDEIGVQRGNQFYQDRNGNGVWNGNAGGDLLQSFGNPSDRPLDGQWRPVGALMAAGGEMASSDSASLSSDALLPIVQRAIVLWANTSLSPTQVQALNHVTFSVADLPGAQLGLSLGGTILLDSDAAGYGWFVDPTPADSSEFDPASLPTSAQHSMDLLSAILHELGHELGFDHDDDVAAMFETLAVGTRRLP